VVKNQLWSITLLILFIPALQVSAQICASPNTFIYGLTSTANVHRINTTNTNVGAQMNPAYTGNPSSYSNAMGYNNTNGRFYYFKRNSYIAPQEFVSFDPALNLVTYLTPSPATTTTIINVGCVKPDGLAYYCIDAYGKLFYYNITLNTWTLITSNLVDQFGNNLTAIVNARIYGDAAFDGLGNLWFLPASAVDYGLYKLKAPLPTTPVASLAVQQVIAPTTLTPNGNSIGGIAFNSTGQIFISTNPPDDKLFRLNNNLTFTLLGTLSVAGVGNDLTSCNFPFTVLPVLWESFTAEVNATQQVVLKWAVGQQSNNSGFFVEHSSDGIHWENLKYFQTDPNENSPAKYSFVHTKPVSGRHYYRIKQVDLDDNYTYSEIKMIDLKNNIQVEITPNPVTDQIKVWIQSIPLNDRVQFSLFDFSGKLIKNSVLNTGVNIVDIRSIPKGTYFLRIRTEDGKTYHERIIKH